MDVHHLRQEYLQRSLDRDQLDRCPLKQFSCWFEEAVNAQVTEPNAMALATATTEGAPSCRMVLMKCFDENGASFFTNIFSRKGMELTANPRASAVFWWKELERQVIIEGPVEAVSREVAAAYFAKRPFANRLGTLASRQGEAIPSRAFLEREVARLQALYDSGDVPLPADWGGFRILPQRYEFWQGRASRVHDRFSYTAANGGWELARLSP